MNPFIKNLSYFLVFFAGIFVLLSIVLFWIPELIPISELPKDDYSEIYKNKIIVAGDSRAERQLDPALLHKYTSSNVINMGQSAHDLYALSKLLLALDLNDKIIIISASSWQLNDGANQSDYFRSESFGDLSFKDKILLYKRDPVSLYQKQMQRFLFCLIYRCSIRNFLNHSRTTNSGYEKIVCKNTRGINSEYFKNHPFYSHPNLNGVKKKLLVKALENLDSLKSCKIIIYNGFVTKTFRAAAKRKGIYDLERAYDAEMMSLTSKYASIRYISYLDRQDIPDSCFYDPQHLCEAGVPSFTKIIAGELDK